MSDRARAAVAYIRETGGPMDVTEKTILSAELRLDVQEFYFRIQAGSDEELRAHANCQILRTFPERRTEYFVSGYYDDRIAVSGKRLNFRDKLCVLDSDVPPESLIYPI